MLAETGVVLGVSMCVTDTEGRACVACVESGGRPAGWQVGGPAISCGCFGVQCPMVGHTGLHSADSMF